MRYADQRTRIKYDVAYGVASAAILCGGSYGVSLLSEGTFPYVLTMMALFSCALILKQVRTVGAAHAAARLLIVVLLSAAFFTMVKFISA